MSSDLERIRKLALKQNQETQKLRDTFVGEISSLVQQHLPAWLKSIETAVQMGRTDVSVLWTVQPMVAVNIDLDSLFTLLTKLNDEVPREIRRHGPAIQYYIDELAKSLGKPFRTSRPSAEYSLSSFTISWKDL